MGKISIFMFLLCAFLAGSASSVADPVITGTSSLTPATLGGGDLATFTFTFSNADTPESSAATNPQVQIQWGAHFVNGQPKYFDVIGVTAAGGAVLFQFDGGGQLTGLTVNYPTLAKGASRTITATFLVPSAGLVNNSNFQTSATLTWQQAPGTLKRGSSATVHASPSLQASLEPIPPSTAPGGSIEYSAYYQNNGTGIAHRAWLIVPVNPNTRLVRVNAGSARPAVWFSTTTYSLEQVNSDNFVRAHFQPGILSDNGSPGDLSDDFWFVPTNIRTMAFFLDDPALNLFPGGVGLQEVVWQVQDNHSEVGTLIDQRLGYFCDEESFNTSAMRTTIIRQLPADLAIFLSKQSAQLMFAGESGVAYFIQRSGDLKTWSDIGGAIETNPGYFSFADPSPLPTRGFYRVASIIEP